MLFIIYYLHIVYSNDFTKITLTWIKYTLNILCRQVDTAIKLALFNDFERVIFKSDCQQVVNALRNDCLYANELDTLLSTCNSLLISNANYNIAYVRRQVNRVAHNLATASLFQSSPSVRHFYPPDCISSIILNEMQGVHFTFKKKRQILVNTVLNLDILYV
jgi:hypothetical protein